jgi:hypothetical protein
VDQGVNIMGQTSRISKNNTKVVFNQTTHTTTVTLHQTDIVVFTAETITLNTGGWPTATTRNRMNQVASEYHLGYRVYQVRGQMFVDTPTPDGQRLPLSFFDGITFNRF